jgi:hypothetical protein
MIEESLKKCSTKLFHILDQNGNRQMAHFVFAKGLEIMRPFRIKKDIWNEHFDPTINSAIAFFKKAKSLMFYICKCEKRLAFAALPILLSIQRRYLHHLKDAPDRMELAKRWIKEYEFISHTLDFGNLYALLNLYHYLRLMAKKYEGEIPKFEKDPNERFLILKSLNLFKIHCEDIYKNRWEELDGDLFTAIPKKVLYLIMMDRPKCMIFKFFIHPEVFSDDNLFFYNNDFLNLASIFKSKFHNQLSFIPGYPTDKNPIFVKFLNSCTEDNSLSKRDILLAWVILYLDPILPWKEN